MNEYISTFITGFSELVAQQLSRNLPGARILAVYDGLIHYTFDGKPTRIQKLPYLNNTFYVMQFFSKATSFAQMVETGIRSKRKPLIKNGTTRIRFSQANQFVGVDKALMRKAENYITGCSSLKLDRLSPATEIWYIARSEGIGFLAQLLYKPSVTEKDLNPGQLRPQLSVLLCCSAHLKANSVVCDPFCGYGSIPKQLLAYFKPQKVWISDLDSDKINNLKKELLSSEAAHITEADARNLSHIPDNSVDAVITDPPWGIYEAIDDLPAFYLSFFREMQRILKPGGSFILLSSCGREVDAAIEQTNFILLNRISTLVNGKKAGVYHLQKT